jgi:hypothetical protein
LPLRVVSNYSHRVLPQRMLEVYPTVLAPQVGAMFFAAAL